MNNILSSLFLAIFFFSAQGYAIEAASNVDSLKTEIVKLALSYQGQGDPDFSKQRSFDPLIAKLIELVPQEPVKSRILLISGVWKQVWGPYDYRNDDRGVNPELGVEEIYQVVSKDGHYYNVSPLYTNGDKAKERIGMLRGEYEVDEKRNDLLRVKFTRYPGLNSRPESPPLWELAALSETGKLENEINIVPTLIVKLFFGKGALREVYTDSDLRILYGSDGKNFKKEALYIMTRVK